MAIIQNHWLPVERLLYHPDSSSTKCRSGFRMYFGAGCLNLRVARTTTTMWPVQASPKSKADTLIQSPVAVSHPWLPPPYNSPLGNSRLFLMRKRLSSGQKWFFRPYFPLIRGMFVFSGLRFSFRALEVPKPRVRKRSFSLTKMTFSTLPVPKTRI